MEKIKAVVFDYGGVLADVLEPADGFTKMGQIVHQLVTESNLTPLDISQDIEEAWNAYDGWKRFQNRRRTPEEISQHDFWDLATCHWGDTERNAIFAQVPRLTQELELHVIQRPANPGVGSVLQALRDAGISLALASNCLSGDAARVQLSDDGLLDLFDAVMFSDETGYRKPGPELLERALAAVQVSPSAACFVGDRIDRDILAGRRTGFALCVLRNAPEGRGRPIRGITEDYSINDLSELLPILGVPKIAGVPGE